MKIKRKTIVLAVPALVALVLVLGLATVSRAATAQQSWPCPASWFPLASQSQAIQQQCSQLKLQAVQNSYATVQARPYATSVITPYPTNLIATPQPDGYLPPEVQGIHQLSTGALAGIIGLPHPITSVWGVGGIPSPTHRGYGALIVDAWGPGWYGPNPTIGRMLFSQDEMPVIGNQVNPAWGTTYNMAWGCPKAIGQITITNVTGQNGDVSFTSSSGVSGTLNMATGAWTFNQ